MKPGGRWVPSLIPVKFVSLIFFLYLFLYIFLDMMRSVPMSMGYIITGRFLNFLYDS